MNTVLAKLNGVTGDLNKITNIFTPREWTSEENERYTSRRGRDQIQIDEAAVN